MNELIEYRNDIIPDPIQIIKLYDDSGIERPTGDAGRIAKMYANSDLVVTAWHNNVLVGVGRSVTDYCYCCYLSDLAVAKAYQHKGIGKEIIWRTKKIVGDEVTLLLVASAFAAGYIQK